VPVTDPELVRDPDTVTLAVDVREPVSVGMLLSDPVADFVAVSEAVAVPVLLRVPVALGPTPRVSDPLGVSVGEGVCEMGLGVHVLDTAVTNAVTLPLRLCVAVTEAERETLPEGLSLAVRLPVAVSDAVAAQDRDTLPVADSEREREEVGV
jgi:hypothetical protein